MKITHVVALLSENGAFGGPMRVALNQVDELRRRGHDVELAAGWTGRGKGPQDVDGTSIRTFRARQVVPGTSFSGLYSPGLRRWFQQRLGVTDVAHIHAGRDLISLASLREAARASRPVVAQTHGMIGPDRRFRAVALDSLAVRRLLGGASAHLVLTEREQENLPDILKRPLPSMRRMRNGVAIPATPVNLDSVRPNVLYCARLHPRKRPLAFVEMAQLVARTDDVTFSMVGPDGGELARLHERIDRHQLDGTVGYEGALPYGRILDRMRAATIYVLPSFDEPFPMTMLEAMSLGLPCVCTDQCGISDELRAWDAAVVTDGSPESMGAAVSGLLRDRGRRQALGARARVAAQQLYSIENVVDELEELYASVLENEGSQCAE